MATKAPRKGGGERVVPRERGPGGGDPFAHHPSSMQGAKEEVAKSPRQESLA